MYKFMDPILLCIWVVKPVAHNCVTHLLKIGYKLYFVVNDEYVNATLWSSLRL